ncbi:TonB family protein [Acidobacteria bacterium AB60]|nr:TonB family protein [Acidobacteria bacterium AB60]
MKMMSPHSIGWLSFLSLSCLSIWTQQPTSIDQAERPALTLTADGVRACPDESKFTAFAAGVYRVGGGVLPPRQKNALRTTLSAEARKYIKEHHIANFEATSVLSLTIDADGKPRDVCVIKEAGYGLDRKAFEGAAKYRFDPATLNGKPVPVRVAIQVRFASF